MTIQLTTKDKAETLNHILTVWLLRIAGLLMFVVGVEYWVRLIGFYEHTLWRFDLMPPWWKLAASALAVLYPVAGVGLWITVSWGVVVWVLVAGVEAVMHLAFPELYGGGTLWLGLHMFGLSLLGALKTVAFVEKRAKKRRSAKSQ